MRMSSAQIHKNAVNIISEQNTKLSRLQEKMGTGKKINTASDDPVALTHILNINHSLESFDQYNKNIDYCIGALTQNETIIAALSEALSRVRELSIQANNGIFSADTRAFIGIEVEYKLKDIINLANTQSVSGEYIFSGSMRHYPAITQDAQGHYQYGGDQKKRFVEIASGRLIPVNCNAKDLLLAIPSTEPKAPYRATTINILTELQRLTHALQGRGENFVDIFNEMITAIDNAQTVCLQNRAEIGAMLHDLEEQKERIENFSLMYKSERSLIEDLDYPQAISDLTQNKTILEAAQRSYLQVQNLNIFNQI